MRDDCRDIPPSRAAGGNAGVPGREASRTPGSRLESVWRSASSIDVRLLEYESRKQVWLAAHKDATSEEVGRAFRRFAKELGI